MGIELLKVLQQQLSSRKKECLVGSRAVYDGELQK